MQRLWQTVGWIGGKLLFLISLALVSLLVLLMPMLRGTRGIFVGAFGPVYGFDAKMWWRTVVYHLGHLLHGQWLPPEPTRAQANAWRGLGAEIWSSLGVSLKLMGVALVAGLLLGIALGWLLSRMAPGWARRPAWGVTTFLNCLPDMLAATFLDLALVFFGRQRSGLAIWQEFLAPVLALTILVLPYVARVTAAAIEDVSGQLYIRTALAKGVAPRDVVLRHMGRNVAVQIWTAMPVIVGILVSSLALIEYLMEIHGIGRALVLVAGPKAEQWYGDRYIGVLLLFPLLVLFTVVSLLTDAGLNLLDPRIRDGRAERAAPGIGRTAVARLRPVWRGRTEARVQQLKAIPVMVRLRLALSSAGQSMTEWFHTLPEGLGRARKALRDPVLLTGLLMVAALVLVALFARQIAPYDPQRHDAMYMAPGGQILTPPFAPGARHWLGTDTFGRDTWSRIILGTRYALIFAGLATPARFGLALLLGMLAAWRGGIWQRLIDWLSVFFTAVPAVILPLALMGLCNDLFADGLAVAVTCGVVLVALPGVPRLAATVRQMTEGVMARPFIEGAVAVGARPGRLLWRHILPQMAPQLATMFTLEVPSVMVMAATLAFFKVSPGGWITDSETHEIVAPIFPEWGSMMDSPLLMVMSGRWWFWAPFGALLVAVTAFTLLGEGLRRRFGTASEWQYRA